MPDESLEEIDMDATGSVDDFIKELEAKEKDLHITSDLSIEIEDPDDSSEASPEFIQRDLRDLNRGHSPTAAQNAHSVGLKTRVFELEKDIVTLEGRVREIRAERNDVQEKSDRRLKDFENYKYRMDRERRGAFIDQISNLASQMLPVLDNLDRALDSASGTQVGRSDEFEQLYHGIVLVNQQVNEVFAGMGVKSIATVGEMFDPNFHEAVAIEERTDIPVNTILEEMLRGYRIGNRVIRHAMVKVTTALPVAKKEAVYLDPDLEPQNQPPAKLDFPDLDPLSLDPQ